MLVGGLLGPLLGIFAGRPLAHGWRRWLVARAASAAALWVAALGWTAVRWRCRRMPGLELAGGILGGGNGGAVAAPLWRGGCGTWRGLNGPRPRRATVDVGWMLAPTRLHYCANPAALLFPAPSNVNRPHRPSVGTITVPCSTGSDCGSAPGARNWQAVAFGMPRACRSSRTCTSFSGRTSSRPAS